MREEYTRTLCENDPLAARTREHLLAIEEMGHRLGWDHPENIGRVFQLQHNPSTHDVAHRWAPAFTDIIKMMSSAPTVDIGDAFQVLAGVVEQAVEGELDFALPARFRNLKGKSSGLDLFTGSKPGWTFYGYGYSYEAWLAVEEQGGETWELFEQNRLEDHPRRIEARQVCFAARDGRLWMISRLRGEEPTAVVEPPDTARTGGPVVNGLSRLTNAAAGNDVPIRPSQMP